MEDEYESYDGFEPKSPSAVDFYDFDDVLSDEGELEDSTHKTVIDHVNFHTNSSLPLPPLTQTDEVVFGKGDKPLAAVLPAKYQDSDVNSLFPDYHPDKSLRHLKIFKIAKHNLPNLWRGVRRKKDTKSVNPKVEIKLQKELEIESDEEIKFLSDKSYSKPIDNPESNVNSKPLNNAWRFGAAKLWYDMVEVPETAETYDYGFKLKEKNEDYSIENDSSCDAYLMVNQMSWENDVIWDGEDAKEEVMQKIMNVDKPAGWIPFLADRTVSGFQEYTKGTINRQDNFMKTSYEGNKMFLSNKVKKTEFQSMFPAENPLLIYDRWEDDVIWDPDNMARISYPKVLEVDDDNIIIDIPEDKPPIVEPLETTKDCKNKKPRPQPKKIEEEEEESSAMNKPDFFNISNDEYYNPKMTQETALKLSYSGSFLQHSIPAVELRPPYFPTHLGLTALQRFHRPTLKIYSHGPFAYFGDFHGVHSLQKHIQRKRREREKELEESGGGEMFFMRTPADLSAQDGDLVLFEFCEEFPPLMNQVGMASKIRNHYRRRPGKETPLKQYEYGETAYHNSPFLGTLQPGESLQAYENHLYRAPIYEHSMQSTDFLIIRTRYQYFIREVKTLYTVGQQLPLVEVPAPKSEKTKSFLKDFLNVFIYRLFWQSPEAPRKIRIEAVKKAFPSIREFSIRKRLNQCATFQRTGGGTKFWILNEQFRLPSEEEIRQTISPEQCCAYYSMLSAEQRLKDAGYGDKLVAAEEDNEFFQTKLEDEVKAAPWNTTQAFIAAAEGKCMLELNGPTDPTGIGLGFSYVRIPNKPQVPKDDNQNPAKRLVRGTDADLRRLSLSAAKKLLKSFNVPDKEIKNMTRWEIVHVVRTLSTEQAKLAEGGAVPKFARGNFHSQAEHAKRYKEECQRLFDLQNSVLSSNEVLSTDEDTSSEEDSDIEEMGKHIESILSDKKTADELSHESEEAQRKDLQKMLASELPIKDSLKAKEDKPPSIEGKILKIYRTYKNSDGTDYERIEIVRRPAVVELYTKIRETKNAEFVKSYSMDEEQKEAIRKEKRRIQDQLRRIKRNELKERTFEPVRKRAKVETPSSKVTCGACGLSGHMRTNRACKMYQNTPSLPPVQVAMTEEQEEAAEKNALNDQNLIQCDETKIILSKQLVQHADEVRKKSLVIKIPKDTLAAAKKKRTSELTNSDYLSTPKMINRKRTDPLVSISVIFENLINELKALPHTQPFWIPVSIKLAPDYFTLIERPMDLHSMKEQIRQHKYKSREDFIKDLQQIIDNSSKYNGPHSFLTITAHTLLEHCFKIFSEKEERLMELEKAINPLLDNDQVAFSFMLESIVTDYLKTVPESWPFHKPVEKRVAKGYYDLIEQPIDLSAIINYCKAHKYSTRQAFIDDVELMYSNSERFNGVDHSYTKKAREIVERCHESLSLYSEQLEKLEAGLKNSNGVNPVVNNILVPKRTRKVGRPKLNADYGAPPSKYNGSVDTDSFIDVESLDTIPDAVYEKESNNSDKSESIQCDSQHSNANDLDLSENSDDDQVDNKDCGDNNNHIASNSFLEDLDLSESDPESQNDADRFQEVHLPSASLPETYNPNSNSDFTSPTVSSKTQSLQHINGFMEVESYGDDSNMNFQLPDSQITCDNICDDLIVSDSESEDMPMEHVLQF
ncbi:transcription initiation factor TFIID subunit 1 [Parasteatoda tepidariorum]|uniref:transcription initiation factor TFIID subunit 1 n=1 Tax=Parasteatoda tepidariorum TaxID=114398 RepID=UPI00077F82A1|nr:transcription initiation factor TFIID subunit 1 [Parasteatoda tepidariorum]